MVEHPQLFLFWLILKFSAEPFMLPLSGMDGLTKMAGFGQVPAAIAVIGVILLASWSLGNSIIHVARVRREAQDRPKPALLGYLSAYAGALLLCVTGNMLMHTGILIFSIWSRYYDPAKTRKNAVETCFVDGA